MLVFLKSAARLYGKHDFYSMPPQPMNAHIASSDSTIAFHGGRRGPITPVEIVEPTGESEDPRHHAYVKIYQQVDAELALRKATAIAADVRWNQIIEETPRRKRRRRNPA